jgi:phosphoribosylformimino-5-aminoimidazole carboxamide ribotide isomerase
MGDGNLRLAPRCLLFSRSRSFAKATVSARGPDRAAGVIASWMGKSRPSRCRAGTSMTWSITGPVALVRPVPQRRWLPANNAQGPSQFVDQLDGRRIALRWVGVVISGPWLFPYPILGIAMETLPALDLLSGRVVRLGAQGDFTQVQAYAEAADDALVLARRYVAEGARRLHVVDLDAARGSGDNRLLIERLLSESGAELQISGGVRTEDDVAHWVARGAAAVLLGTAAVRDPGLLERAAASHPGRIMAALDVRQGHPAIGAWSATERLTVADVLNRWSTAALAGVVVTSVDRDGTLGGPDLELLAQVLAWAHVPVTYSGGVGSLDDLKAVGDAGAAAVILGRSLLEGRILLQDALSL